MLFCSTGEGAGEGGGHQSLLNFEAPCMASALTATATEAIPWQAVPAMEVLHGRPGQSCCVHARLDASSPSTSRSPSTCVYDVQFTSFSWTACASWTRAASPEPPCRAHNTPDAARRPGTDLGTAAGDINQLDSLRFLGLFSTDSEVPLLVQAVQQAVVRTLDLSQSGLTGTFPSWLITALLDAPTNINVNLTVTLEPLGSLVQTGACERLAGMRAGRCRRGHRSPPGGPESVSPYPQLLLGRWLVMADLHAHRSSTSCAFRSEPVLSEHDQ